MNMKGSLTHQFDVPLVIGCMIPIHLPIAAQFPRVNDFSLSDRNTIPFLMGKHLPFHATKLSVANLFATLLRFTATPCADRCTLSTFSHNANNVKRGRKLLMRHSVKHYKALRSLFKNSISFSSFDLSLQS